jgi:hypothetical protein
LIWIAYNETRGKIAFKPLDNFSYVKIELIAFRYYHDLSKLSLLNVSLLPIALERILLLAIFFTIAPGNAYTSFVILLIIDAKFSCIVNNLAPVSLIVGKPVGWLIARSIVCDDGTTTAHFRFRFLGETELL